MGSNMARLQRTVSTKGRTGATSMMLSPTDLVDQGWLAHVLQGVADAAAPVAEEAAKAAEPGLFDQFVGTVKHSIETLHGKTPCPHESLFWA